MGGGPKDIDKTPDKPFSPSDSHKVTQAKPAQTTPEGMTPDESTVLDLAPTWGRWSQIFYPADKTLDPAPVGTVAEVYRDIAGILKAGFTDMDNGMKTVLADQWSGAGADAAQQVTQAYVANGDALHAAVMGMNVNLVNLSDVVSVTKSNLPHPDDVKSYLETAVNDAIESANRQGHITVTTPDSQDPQFTLTGNVQYSRAGGHTSVTAAQIQPLFDEALRSVDEVAQNTMSSSFYPGLQASDRGVPAYAIATPNTSAPPSAPPGGPGSGGAGGGGGAPPSFSGGGGGGLGGGGGASGGGGAPPSAADVAAQTRQLLETGGPGGNPAGPMPTGVDPMGGGANTPGGSGASAIPGALGGVPGMSGASGASDAMKKAMSQGAALAGIPSPAGLSGLQSKLGGLGKPGEIPALKGLSGLPHGAGAGGGGAGGGGAGGGGAGAGGGGGAGPLGAPKAMSDAATREASISQGLRESAAAERGAATAARAGSAAAPAGGGAPMGGGGGARGGGGGEDKEHKTNKFLRSTRRGEDLLGQAPPATAAVIGPQ